MVYHAKRESDQQYLKLEREFQKYQSNAEEAINRALRQHPEDKVSIGEYGEVFRHGGRTDRIQ